MMDSVGVLNCILQITPQDKHVAQSHQVEPDNKAALLMHIVLPQVRQLKKFGIVGREVAAEVVCDVLHIVDTGKKS
jgi:hypothetical protein